MWGLGVWTVKRLLWWTGCRSGVGSKEGFCRLRRREQRFSYEREGRYKEA